MNREMTPNSGAGIIAPTPGDSEGDSGHVATRMLVNVLLQFHQEVHIFTRATAVFDFDNKRVHIHQYTKPYSQSAWYFRLLGQLFYQIKFAIGIFRVSNSLDLVIFGGGGFPIPSITAQIFRIHFIHRIGGVTYKEVPEESYRHLIWLRFLKSSRRLQYFLADTIVVLSPSLIEFADIGRFKSKCIVFNHYYFNLDIFSNSTKYAERRAVFGHIGASRTKGTMKLLEAFTKSGLSEEYQLVILGDGPQLQEAKTFAKDQKINIAFTGYLNRSELPDYYNNMKLFVNCSESEGVPKAMFEAMACGTPVAATPVGGIPDYIENGENGFILSTNSPEQLAKELLEIAEHTELETVANEAQTYVLENFSYQSTVDSYYKLITEETQIPISPPSDDLTEPLPRHD